MWLKYLFCIITAQFVYSDTYMTWENILNKYIFYLIHELEIVLKDQHKMGS